jgi:NitT/TauT family transport system permease protein/taurine transport system permease protein
MAAAIGLGIALWGAFAAVAGLPPGKFPSPRDVLDAVIEHLRSGALLANLLASSLRLAAGFAIGATLGFVLGLAIVTSKAVSEFFRPLVTFFQAIAGVAWIPLAIMWFGLGAGPTLFVTANAVFFIVLFNTIAGAAAVPESQIAAVRVLGGGRWAVFREVLLPGALVYVLVGVETGLAFGWRALISVEIIAGTNGLGTMLSLAGHRFDAATIVLVIVVVGLFWLLIERAVVRPLRRATIDRWRLVSADES